MLLICLGVVALAALGLGLWIVRGDLGRGSRSGSLTQLHKVDVPAFRNLLAREDDEFLRRSLNSSHYRQVRRARLRAAQEYLIYIAQDCTALLRLLRDSELPSDTEPDRASMKLARVALRLRLISLGFWWLLWIEYLLPEVHIRPRTVIDKYEETLRSADLYLGAHPDRRASAPGQVSA